MGLINNGIIWLLLCWGFLKQSSNIINVEILTNKFTIKPSEATKQILRFSIN